METVSDKVKQVSPRVAPIIVVPKSFWIYLTVLFLVVISYNALEFCNDTSFLGLEKHQTLAMAL